MYNLRLFPKITLANYTLQ